MTTEKPLPPDFDPEHEVLLNERSLRALAHPVRVKLLGLLRIEGPATATGLAEHLGLNSGATSYHLRQLAGAGFIVEDAERGTGRDRWWRAAHRSTWYVPQAAESDDPAAGHAYLRAVGMIAIEQLQASLDQSPTLPLRWQDAETMSDYALRLTPDELDELNERVSTLIRSYRRYDPEDSLGAPPDAAPVQVQIQAFVRPGALDVEP
ncbi:ArsR/SmtB family transcription factor [Flindersiella endophytica]